MGGAIIGSSIATFLAQRDDFDGRIVVVERDPTFRTSSTTLSAASIRLQFSTPLNIEISRFGVEVIKHLDRYLAVDGVVPEVDFVENGYLFLATDAGLATLERNHAMQRQLDVAVTLLTPAELKARFDWITVDDLAGASLGLSDEGWFDAYALLQGFRRKAKSLGVEERIGEVVGLERDGDRLSGVRLADGSVIEADWVVNAAGPRAASVADMAGIQLPVRPRKRLVFHVEAPVSLGAAPLTIDPTGVYFRPEGPAYIAGFSPRDGDDDPDTLDLAPDRAPFESFVWPALAHRVAAFDRLRLLDTWAGHYEVNVARPQRHRRATPGHCEPAVRERLLRSRAPAGTSRRTRAGRVDRTRSLRVARPVAAWLRPHRAQRADPRAERRLRRAARPAP